MSTLKKLISVALGVEKADLVLKNAKVVDVFCNKITAGDVAICGGKIAGVGSYCGETEIDICGQYVMPSFFDTHVHFESSLLTPAEYLKLAAPHGVTMINADPHEIANVCGEDGIAYMIESARGIPVDVNFMFPSCVPATPFDHGNAVLSDAEIERIKKKHNFFGLAEMMNYPGVIFCDEDVLKKLEHAPFIDGHAPRLSGKELNAYLAAGIRTDHECESGAEALEKISKGMYVMLREGSEAKNLHINVSILNQHTLRRTVFCTDDRTANDLAEKGTISNCIAVAVGCGVNPIDAIKIASLNAYECYGIKNKGAIAPSFDADIVVAKDIVPTEISMVFKAGQKIAENGKALFEPNRTPDSSRVTNTVRIQPVTAKDFELKFSPEMPVMQVVPKTVLTKKVFRKSAKGLNLCAVIERHKASGNIGKCYVEGFDLKGGAIAQTIGHDAHNITVLGDNEKDMALAVSELGTTGGMVLVHNGKVVGKVELPIAGLMSDKPAAQVIAEVAELNEKAKALDVNPEIGPFMVLSFLSLIVLPELKLSDSGLFDVTTFSFIK